VELPIDRQPSAVRRARELEQALGGSRLMRGDVAFQSLASGSSSFIDEQSTLG